MSYPNEIFSFIRVGMVMVALHSNKNSNKTVLKSEGKFSAPAPGRFASFKGRSKFMSGSIRHASQSQEYLISLSANLSHL